MITTSNGGIAVYVYEGNVVIDGGSYSSLLIAVCVAKGSAEINGGSFTGTNYYAVSVTDNAYVTIEGGTFSGSSASIEIVTGTTSIKGGTFTAGSEGHISYERGTLNLSEYGAVNGLTLSQRTGSDLTVSDETIKLPEGYVFKDRENNTVDTLASRIVYTIGTEPTYNVTIGENITGGSVSVNKTTAKQGDTVTVTVEANAGYAYVVGSLSVKNTATGDAVEVNEEAKTFVMPAAAVTVTASFEKLPVTSADIVWGSMSFTYTDGENGAEDGAWSNDGSDGAGTVTVTNTGNDTFIANVAYQPESGYTEITGKFDADSAELAAEASKTFTLTLNGKPNGAIPAGTKIGSVTVTIVEAADG